MSKALFRGTLGCCLVLAAAALPLRAEEVKKPHSYVVLVGIDKYADKDIHARAHAEADAQALYDTFTDKGVLGVGADHVRLLLGSEDAKRKSQPATRDNILKALHWVTENAKQDDLVIFAFIGEGGTLTPQGDRLCYFAADSTVKDRAKNAVAAADIAQELDKLKSQRFCTFLDVSFKGFSLGKDEAPEPNLGEATPFKEFLGNEGKEDKGPAPGRVLFVANISRNPALDLEKHGVFTHVVVKGLRGAADKEGYEPDGLITVDELTEYVDKEVRDLARTKIKDELKRPDPAVFGGRSTHFVLTHNPEAMPKVQAQLQKFAEAAKKAKLSEKLVQEGTDLLSHMPRLDDRQAMRKAYQEFAEGGLSLDKFQAKHDELIADTKLRRTDALKFAEKVMEAVQLLHESYVNKDKVNEGELVGWAIRGLYRRLDEKVPPDFQDRLAKVKDLKEAELTVLLADVRERIGKRSDLKDHKDIDIALQRMTSHLDPYTTYVDPDTKRRLDQDIRGEFTGIGIQIRKENNRDMLQVSSPLKGSPAHKAGIMAGDVITKITSLVDKEGKPLAEPDTVSTKGLLMSKAVERILGVEGTPVKLTIDREGEDKPLEFTIKRGRIEVESVLGYKRKTDDDSWNYMIDPKSKIAYVRLTSFQNNTARDLENLMKDLKKEKIKGLVLDLRFNPGGLLTSAVKVSDLFIDDGLIVSIRPRGSREVRYSGNHDGSYLDFPLVCMVNSGSASGSEIVAACLQDHKRAVILGERSYGKGSVQNIADFDGGELKLTTASYWRPSGKNINKSSTGGKDEEEWGVLPDKGFELKLSRKETEDLFEHQEDVKVIQRKDRTVKPKPEFKDRQLDKALDYLRDQIKMASKGPATVDG